MQEDVSFGKMNSYILEIKWCQHHHLALVLALALTLTLALLLDLDLILIVLLEVKKIVFWPSLMHKVCHIIFSFHCY